MLKQKFIFILTSFVFVISFSYSYAQDQETKPKKTPEERASMITERMKKGLELTDEQYSSVYNIILEAQKQRDVEIAKREELKKAAKERFEKTEAGLKEVLTPDQFSKLQEHKKKMIEKRKMKREIKNK